PLAGRKSSMSPIVRVAVLALILPALAASPAMAQGTVIGPGGKPGPAPGGTAAPSAPGGAPGTVYSPSGPIGGAPAQPPAQPQQQPGANWGNSQVDIVYAEPQNPAFAPIREKLMRRQVLEQLRLFLSPL